jgi:hypothetical protein
VRDDRPDAGLLAIALEESDLVFAVRVRRPLARRAREDLDRVALDFFAFEQRFVDATGDGHMRAQQRALQCWILNS